MGLCDWPDRSSTEKHCRVAFRVSETSCPDEFVKTVQCSI